MSKQASATAIQKHEKEELLRRLWAKTTVDSDSGCWVWNGSRTQGGYGTLSFRGKMWIASRLSVVLTGAELARVWVACHHCDNPPCWNPDHLYAGTHQDNSDDRIRRGRSRVLPKLTDDQVWRICRLHYAEGWGLSRIAREYGVTSLMIDKAIQRSNRQDIEAEWAMVHAETRYRRMKAANEF